MTFLDKNGAEIDFYNPCNNPRGGPIHEIADNEELIGVYGVRNKNKNNLSTFGFIVKVRLV